MKILGGIGGIGGKGVSGSRKKSYLMEVSRATHPGRQHRH
jgi:hypothetical protein